MKRFPIFLFFAFFVACHLRNNDNTSYKHSVQRAEKHYEKFEKDSAFHFYNKAYVSCNQKDIDRKLYTSGMMATIQNQYGDYYGAEQTLTEVISLENETKNMNYLTQIYNEFGKSYRMQKNYAYALKYYNKCILVNNDSFYDIILKNNKAVIYIDNEKADKALNLLLPLLKRNQIKQDLANQARILDNIGLAYLKLGNYKESSNFLNHALLIREQLNDDYQKTTSYLNLAKYYEDINIQTMLLYAEKALNSAITSKNPDNQLEALTLLIKNPINKNLNNHFRDYVNLNDSLIKVRQQDKNQFAKIKFDYSTAIKESTFQKNQKILFLLLFIFGTISAIIGYFFFKKKNKLKLHQSVYDTETRLSKKLHDELANDVFQTLTFVENKNLDNKQDKNMLLDYLEKIYQQTRNISRNNSDIDLTENYFENLLLMINNYNSEILNLIVNTNQIKVLKLEKPTKIILFRTLQELLINMKKHSQANLVFITFKENLKNFEITYADNGIGANLNSLEKNGLKNVENRIFSIKGTFNFDTHPEKGFKASIIIPK